MAEGVKLFDPANFAAMVEEQNALLEERAAAQLVHQGNVESVTQDQVKLDQRFQRGVAPMRQNLNRLTATSQHQRQLEGGGFWDQLRAMGLETLDSKNYTQEGRAKQLNEDQDIMRSMMQFYDFDKTTLQTRLLSTAADVQRAALVEQIGADRLKNIVDGQQMLAQGLSASNVLQEQSVLTLDLPGVKSALAAAQQNGGIVNIGGVDVRAPRLTERLNALEDRQYQQEQRAVDRMANNLKLETMAQEKELRTFALSELIALPGNGYKGAGDVSYDPALVDRMIAFKQKAEADSLQEQIINHNINNLDEATLAAESHRTDKIETRAEPNSPLAQEVRKYRTTLNHASLGAGKDKPRLSRIMAQTILESGKTRFDAAVEAQAVEDSKGHANAKEYQAIRAAHLRGTDVPQEAVEELVTLRLKDQRSLEDFLPRDVAQIVDKRYREILVAAIKVNPLAAQGILQPGNGPDSEEKKMIRAAAAKQALEEGINSQLVGRTDVLFTDQVNAQGHPLQGLVTPEGMLGLIKKADNEVAAEFANDKGLTNDELTAVRAGLEIDNPEGTSARDSNILRQELRELQQVEILAALNDRQPGLGELYVDWWQTKGTEFVKNNQIKTAKQESHDMKSTLAASLRNTVESSRMLNVVSDMITASHGIEGHYALQRSQTMHFGGDPRKTQIMLLHQDTELDDPTRRILYTDVILPLYTAARADGLSDYNEINDFIEKHLVDASPPDGTTQKALKTLMRNRTQEVERMMKFITVPPKLGKYFLTETHRQKDMQKRLDKGLGSADWYSDLLTGNK